MSLRIAKVLLIAAVALLYALVVFNNFTDYDSNYQYVHHVLLMDTTFPGNHLMWRAIHPGALQVAFYDGIIGWETLTTVLLWMGVIQLARALRKPAGDFNRAKRVSVIALTAAMLLWFGAFITVGGEWFVMWQSKIWNGQEAAFRMFACIGIVFVLLAMPDLEEQP